MNASQIAELIKREIDRRFDQIDTKTYYRGVITAVSSNKASVQIEGLATPFPDILSLGNYRPKVGDRVLVLSIGKTGTNFVILGPINLTQDPVINYMMVNGTMYQDVQVKKGTLAVGIFAGDIDYSFNAAVTKFPNQILFSQITPGWPSGTWNIHQKGTQVMRQGATNLEMDVHYYSSINQSTSIQWFAVGN